MAKFKHDKQQAAHMIGDLINHWTHCTVQPDDKWVWDQFRAQTRETWFGMIVCGINLIDAGYSHPAMSHERIEEQLTQLYNCVMLNNWEHVMSTKFEGRSHYIKTNVWRTVRTMCELCEQAMVDQGKHRWQRFVTVD